MSRRIITFIFVISVLATFFLYPKSQANEVLGMPNFTVITRTSTPPPSPPTATRDDDDGDNGGSNPTTPPTAVPPTNTPTLIPVTLVATPVGGFLPTAAPCGLPPTVQAQNTTFVRMGPGTDYDIIGQLVFLETRPIVARAADSEWWVIQFTNEQFGWVADAVVLVHGNTSGIPVIGAPEINGETPTPGPLWSPTPNPECPILPTATPIPTETATSTPEQEPTETPVPTETATEVATEVVEEVEPTATATSVVPTAETDLEEVETETPQPTAEPLDEEAPGAVSALPCATAMIGLAVVGFILFRRVF
jgi:uncharacterized protein YgiM (DUF1202 family)